MGCVRFFGTDFRLLFKMKFSEDQGFWDGIDSRKKQVVSTICTTRYEMRSGNGGRGGKGRAGGGERQGGRWRASLIWGRERC
jgi:hypothetical protein